MSRAHSLTRRFRPAALLGAFSLAALLLAQNVWAELEGPSDDDRHVTRSVVKLLGDEHLSQHALNDEISQRCLDAFLKTLDPMKVYFDQTDVDAFHVRRNDLDDMIRRGDVSFAFDVFRVFLTRVDERVALAQEFLQAEHDFTIEEEMVSDPDAAVYAANGEEARENWRKRIKYDILLQKVDDKSVEDARERLGRRYASFAKRMHQTSNDELLEMYLTALTTSYDPHTSFMSAETLENFEIQMRLQLDGIGASLMNEDGYTVIKEIIPGGAAALDGRLKPEDRVTAVGQGDSGEMVDVADMKLNDVVAMIRGKRGTVVRLQVMVGGAGESQVYNITRASIELKSSEAQAKVFQQGQKSDGSPFRLGVIDLPSFYMDMEAARLRRQDYKSTTRDVRKILDGFKRDKVDAVVVDLRRNGGGSLTESINLTGLFIDTGPVVQVKGPDGRVQHYDDVEAGTAWDGPLVVLTSKFSASASEIFAGAIQDYGRGLIVGDYATHGKGTVQSLMDLAERLGQDKNLGALKLTMQQFYRPNGDSTQSRGVLADVELPSITTHLDVSEDDLDFHVPFDKVDAARFQKVNQVDATVLDQIRRRSVERWQQSEDFQKVQRNIERYLERKSRTTITLNEAAFRALRDESGQSAEEEAIEEAVDGPSEPIKRNYYLDEALNITLDYLTLMNVAQNN